MSSVALGFTTFSIAFSIACVATCVPWYESALQATWPEAVKGFVESFASFAFTLTLGYYDLRTEVHICCCLSSSSFS